VAVDLRNRSLLTVQDFTRDEFLHVLDVAAALKAQRRAGEERRRLEGKVVCLVFEKTSTRTRCAFEVASYHQGAAVTSLDPQGSQMGHKESAADTAMVLGRMYDAIAFRGARQATVETLARHAGVPVYNALTDEYHPTQMLADMMTMREHSDRPLHETSFAYVGDTRSNMGHSLMIAGCLLGMDVRIAGPRSLWPSESYVAIARDLERRHGARLTITDDPQAAVAGADFVHTDVWVSMGEPKEVWQERIDLLRPFQVDARLMAASGRPGTRFMHCLPAFHDAETAVGRDIALHHGLKDGLEVTDAVFASPANIAFDQAENRMHTTKALLVATLHG
jgi:ornithine carbamoyltransferase